MSQPIGKKYYTPEEYLALEEQAAYKSEYFAGEILQMSGGSLNHSLIITNMITAFKTRLRPKGCRTYESNMRLMVAQNGLYTYPDVMVVCGKVELAPDRNDTITNPTVIVEVLSDSTANYDRGLKAKRYLAIPSLQYYLLIEQKAVYVERRQKGETSEWAINTYVTLEETLSLPELEIEIPLAEIYDQIDFTPSQS